LIPISFSVLPYAETIASTEQWKVKKRIAGLIVNHIKYAFENN
jgi:hypothetical protein